MYEPEVTLYTQCNIWYQNPAKLFAINFKKGTIIPAGTRVVFLNMDRNKIVFRTLDDNNTYNMYLKYQRGLKADDIVKRFFAKKTFGELTSKFSPREINLIKRGRVEQGMTRDAVLVSYGYPPAHRTPLLHVNRWLYWSSRRRSMALEFDRSGRLLPGKSVPSARFPLPTQTISPKPPPLAQETRATQVQSGKTKAAASPVPKAVEIAIPQTPIRLAIIDFDHAESLSNEARAINQIVSDECFDTRCYTLTERGQVRKIINEHSFQQSGMTEDAVAIGKMLSVDYVMIGSLYKLGDRYILSMRMIQIKLNRIIASERLEHEEKIERITGKIRNAVREITSEAVNSVQ